MMMVEDADCEAEALLGLLSEVARKKTECVIESDGCDHTLECEECDIAFVLDEADETLQIRKLDVRNNRTLGKKIVKIFNRFADKHNLGLTALVLDQDEGLFWEKLGYAQSSHDPSEFFRAE